jgi:hypothetical protein
MYLSLVRLARPKRMYTGETRSSAAARRRVSENTRAYALNRIMVFVSQALGSITSPLSRTSIADDPPK